MKEKFLIERIKLLTEWLRGFFTLFIIIGTGVATLWIRKSFITYNSDGSMLFNYNIDYYTMMLGAIFVIIIFIIIVIINKKISRNINKLKQL